jgi:hypothetical protein
VRKMAQTPTALSLEAFASTATGLPNVDEPAAGGYSGGNVEGVNI